MPGETSTLANRSDGTFLANASVQARVRITVSTVVTSFATQFDRTFAVIIIVQVNTFCSVKAWFRKARVGIYFTLCSMIPGWTGALKLTIILMTSPTVEARLRPANPGIGKASVASEFNFFKHFKFAESVFAFLLGWEWNIVHFKVVQATIKSFAECFIIPDEKPIGGIKRIVHTGS